MATSAIPHAVNFRHELGGGMSRPCVFECSDGEDRVLKFESRATKAALASDWLGALLATELGVRTPAPSLVLLDEEAIETIRPHSEADALPGYAFGAAYLPHAQNATAISGILSCDNHTEVLGRLVVLDTWIGTEDRLRPDKVWNLIRETDLGSTPQLVAIDFGMAFTGALVPLFGQSDSGQAHLVCPSELRALVSLDATEAALTRAEEVTEAEIVTAVETTPESWLSPAQRGRVIRFLLSRREHLRASLAELEASA